MKITLGKKLFLYTCGTLVGLLLATFLILESNQARQWQEHLRTQSITFARFATPELLKYFRGSFPPTGQENLRDIYDLLGINPDLIRFSLLSPGGKLLFRSAPFPAYAGMDLSSLNGVPDLSRLRRHKTTVRTLVLPGGKRVLDLVIPAFGPTGEQVLAVRYLISHVSVDARLMEMRLYFLRLGLLAILCSVLLAALVVRRVTRPIQALTAGARAIARGELRTRISPRSRDEIGTLARAFNEMAESLSAGRTELTARNAELTQANTELQRIQENLIRAERLAAIGQLAAGVSHEIDNPVGIILGYAELLRAELATDDPRRQDAEAIIEECRRCRRITGGLLGFARRVPASTEILDLSTLASNTLDSLRPQKLFRALDIRFQADSPDIQVVGDADQLRQVLVNLLLNAAQAMAGEGTLTLAVQQEQEQAVVLVADSGPGVPAELQERIFEPFFSTKASGEGTGLGLAVCRRLVEDHGGTLEVEAAAGGGALFRVNLPFADREKYFDKASVDSIG